MTDSNGKSDNTDGIPPATTIYSYGSDYDEDATEVILEEGVTIIGEEAFINRKSLTSVILPSIDIPSILKTVENSAFRGCSSLVSIDLAKTILTYIGERAFKDCTSLTSITLPITLKYIDESAFQNCSSLQTIDIPSNVKESKDNAFENTSLTSIDLFATKIKDIYEATFSSCKSLISVKLPSNLKLIDRKAFQNCTSLVSIDLAGVLIIMKDAFRNCTSLSSMDIPQRIGIIGDCAFKGCRSLKSIIVPLNSNVHIDAFDDDTDVIFLHNWYALGSIVKMRALVESGRARALDDIEDVELLIVQKLITDEVDDIFRHILEMLCTEPNWDPSPPSTALIEIMT